MRIPWTQLPAALAFLVFPAALALGSQPGTLRYASPTREGPTRLTLVRKGADIEIRETDTGREVARAPMAETWRVEIVGVSGESDDTLTVDLSGGLIDVPGGVDFDGGAGGFDSLVLRGGRVRDERHVLLGPHDGLITLDSMSVRYRNLEPVTDTVAGPMLLINGTAGFDSVTFSNGAVGTTVVSSPSFESVTFANKTTVTYDGISGGDAVNLNNPAPAAGLTTLLLVNVATVTQTAAVKVPNLGIKATGAITLNLAGNTLSAFEARTDNGNIDLLNTGSLNIGGVTPTLTGLTVTTSGDVTVSSTGSITLVDVDGPENIHSGSTAGDVSITASGATSDISSIVDRDAVTSPRGSISLTAGRDILFGTTGADNDNDVRADTTITFSAGRDVFVDGFSDVASDDFGQSTGGSVTVVAGRDAGVVNAHGDDASIGANGTAGGGVSIATGAGRTFTMSAPSSSDLFANSGSITILADKVAIVPPSGITASSAGASIDIRPVTTSELVNLGSTTDAAVNTLELSNAELNRLFTPSVLIGSTGNGGQMTISAPIAASMSFTNLMLRAGSGGFTSAAGSLAVPGKLTFQDQGSTAHTYTITGLSLTQAPNIAIPYSALTELVVNAGSGSDSFNVTPSASSVCTLNGGSPNPPAAPGDSLNVSTAGTTNPALTVTLSATGYAGGWTFGNRQPVNFSRIESPGAPPAVTKAFNPAAIDAGTPVQLTITLTNPNAAALTGVGFTDTYPMNLLNAIPASGASSCGGALMAIAGTGSLTLSGGTIPASGSCFVVVNVVANVANSYMNLLTAGSVSSSVGPNVVPGSATLTVCVAQGPTVTPPAPLAVTQTLCQ